MTLLEKAREHWRENLRVIEASDDLYFVGPPPDRSESCRRCRLSSCAGCLLDVYWFSAGLVSISSEDCVLCETYGCNGCRGCPVSEATGVSGCGYTPYYEVQALLITRAPRLQVRDAVKKMVDFLDGLEDPEL
mgnify:CR=1 FL=1